MKKERHEYGRPYNDQLRADNLVLVGDSHLVWKFNPGSILGLPYLMPVLVHAEEITHGAD
jgi:hypothetical protein